MNITAAYCVPRSGRVKTLPYNVYYTKLQSCYYSSILFANFPPKKNKKVFAITGCIGLSNHA